jgi:hypothetical protein
MQPRRSGANDLRGELLGPRANIDIGSTLSSASDGTVVGSSIETPATTSTCMAFASTPTGACNEQERGYASVGPTVMEDGGRASNGAAYCDGSACLTFTGRGICEPRRWQ